MARLQELTCATDCGNLQTNEGIKISDVIIAQDKLLASINVCFTKIAEENEIQHILLTATHNILCPVRALLRRVASVNKLESSLT
jgi:hypothetical protein